MDSVEQDSSGSGSSPPKRRWPQWLRWLTGGLGVVAVLVVVAVVLFAVLTRNPSPGEFYDSPADVPTEPGMIIRSEEFTAGVPDGAQGWKILYASTNEEGEPIAVSGLIVAPTEPSPGPRPVLAWSHGTTGVVPACAPSLSRNPFAGIPDMTAALAQGWVVTMTDYPGLGTPAPHPYLVGGSEGRAVLDSVRAVQQFDVGVPVDDRYAVWGHSQGGHAALWAGQLADDYVPELELVGVAALAPATTLADNFTAIEGTEVGNVLTIYAIHSWSRYYDDVGDDVLTSRARRPAGQIADDCLNQPSRFRIVASGLVLPDTITDVDVATDPTWTPHLDANTPTPDAITAPLFVAQGLGDRIIAPSVTETWVAERCADGAQVEWRTYPDVTHPGIVGPGGADALTWTQARFDEEDAATTCPS